MTLTYPSHVLLIINVMFQLQYAVQWVLRCAAVRYADSTVHDESYSSLAAKGLVIKCQKVGILLEYRRKII